MRSGVRLSLTDYALLPAKERTYLIIWNEVVTPKEQGLTAKAN